MPPPDCDRANLPSFRHDSRQRGPRGDDGCKKTVIIGGADQDRSGGIKPVDFRAGIAYDTPCPALGLVMSKRFFLLIALMLALAGSAGSANAALVISKGKTANVDCESGVCNATAVNAVLNTKSLAKMLASSDVYVYAEGVATDITVADPFSWASSHKLTLGAYGSLNVKAAIAVEGTSALTLAANVGQMDGLFRLVGVGKNIVLGCEQHTDYQRYDLHVNQQSPITHCRHRSQSIRHLCVRKRL